MSIVTSTPTLEIQLSDHAASAEDRAKRMVNPGFGHVFSDHMVVVPYKEGQGWGRGHVVRLRLATLALLSETHARNESEDGHGEGVPVGKRPLAARHPVRADCWVMVAHGHWGCLLAAWGHRDTGRPSSTNSPNPDPNHWTPPRNSLTANSTEKNINRPGGFFFGGAGGEREARQGEFF